jgi:hypothetical protein
LICRTNVVVSGRRSNGSKLLFPSREWKRISASGSYGDAFFFADGFALQALEAPPPTAL